MEKDKYGHITKGKTNIKNLWFARDSIVSTLNELNVMLLGRRSSPIVKEIRRIIKRLEFRLKETELKLGIK